MKNAVRCFTRPPYIDAPGNLINVRPTPSALISQVNSVSTASSFHCCCHSSFSRIILFLLLTQPSSGSSFHCALPPISLSILSPLAFSLLRPSFPFLFHYVLFFPLVFSSQSSGSSSLRSSSFLLNIIPACFLCSPNLFYFPFSLCRVFSFRVFAPSLLVPLFTALFLLSL